MFHVLNQKWNQLEGWLLFGNKALVYLYSAACVFHLFVWGILAANFQTVYQPTKEFITLHYKVGIGPDFVGPWYVIFGIPLLGLAVLIVNCVLSRTVYHQERFSAYALAAAAASIQIILGWVLYLTVKANLF